MTGLRSSPPAESGGARAVSASSPSRSGPSSRTPRSAGTSGSPPSGSSPTRRTPISSHELARSLGVTQKSAWFMLHRIREAMETGHFEKMSGTTEVDDTFIGGLAKNMHQGRKAKITGSGGIDKTDRARCPQPRDWHRGRRRGFRRRNLQANVLEWVEPGSALFTDQPRLRRPGPITIHESGHSLPASTSGASFTRTGLRTSGACSSGDQGQQIHISPEHFTGTYRADVCLQPSRGGRPRPHVCGNRQHGRAAAPVERVDDRWPPAVVPIGNGWPAGKSD